MELKAPAKKPVSNFSWAELNPFARADRGQLTPPNDNNTRTRDDPNPDPNLDTTKDKEKVKLKPGDEGHDPMADFESLWQPNLGADGKPIQDSTDNSSYLPALDATKLNTMVGKMKFSGDFTPEELEAVKAGGESAVTALTSMMDKVGRKAFQNSLAITSKLTEHGFSRAKDRFMGEVPDRVRDLMTDNELSGSVSIMNNPAFSPMVASVKAQYLKKFPKATPNEVKQAVKSYFDHFAAELTKKPDGKETTNSAAQKLRSGSPDADFEAWFESELRGPQSQFSEDGSDPSQK